MWYILKLMYISQNEELKNHTTFQIGGPADEYYEPETFEELIEIIHECNTQEKKHMFLGGGSNLVFSDKGYRGAIICTRKLNKIKLIESNLVIAEAGATMKELVDFCTENGLSGFEEFAGLPGTVGGALYMNARCFDKSISENLFETHWLEKSEEDGEYKNREMLFEEDEKNWEYKKSPFQGTERIIKSGTFKVNPVENDDFRDVIRSKCAGFIKGREERGHFKYPSAGSVFKNNHEFGKPSGKIIDEAGLRGYRIGGAQVAEFHGNFIVNTDNASADDVRRLVVYVQDTVKHQFGFDLEPEIIFIEE